MTLAPPASTLVRLTMSRGRRLGSGWAPAALVGVLAVAVFLWCGVSWRDLVVFAGYVGVGLVLPGTLLWRALTGGGRSMAEDLAAGLAFGYAVEVPAYLPARAVGQPLLVLVVPVAVVAAFVCVPRLRRHWRGPGLSERVPPWCAWVLAGIVAFLIVWSAVHLYGVPVGAAYGDLPYHLALVGELRHHVPPALPVVLGEPLSYHWFVYAELAATSWVTGIEPLTLVYRLGTLPMAVATVVLVAVLGRRLGGSWGAGAAAAGVTYFLFSPELVEGVVFSSRSMFTVWASPTQTFGALLFAAVMTLLVRRRMRWAALAVLLAVLSGAKATYLPLLLAGLITVVAVRRRAERRWLVAAGLTLGFLVVAHVVLYGGGQGTRVDPFATMRALWGQATIPTLALLTGVHLFCLVCVWGGAAGLGRRALEPPLLLMLGIGAAGIGAAVLLGHPAQSQLYFLEAARPYLSIAAVCGVLAAPPVSWARAACLAGLGAGGALLVAAPDIDGGPPARVVAPYAVLAVAALAVWRRGHVLAVVALLTGYALPTSVRVIAAHVTPEERRHRLIPKGALAAGRWLRDHSSPGDVVATDLHCHHPRWKVCDSRHFYVSAFTERRVLVEGWAYAESTLARAGTRSYLEIPYADQARLAANDAAFTTPTAQNVQRLATDYGVRWLYTGIRPELDAYARLRFRNATTSVYELSSGR
ncbi:hypothetical protein ACFFR3_05530 [Nonomuraea salmonea]|uniref:Glycosyltransferase RgtA/B/C/D-like domain-containing protein n=1 Tax=Nonomuraea salmonea TaxID=46181 RepID=A0ABV5NF95_9ACTN